MDVAVRLRNGIRENGAVSAKRILGLMNEAEAMAQLASEQCDHALQDVLPLGIADQWRKISWRCRHQELLG